MTRVNIKAAASKLNPHHFEPMTIGSIDLGELVTTRVVECSPKFEFSRFHGEGMLRLLPQSFPPYGRIYMKRAAFFVPNHQLVEYADAIRSDMKMYRGKAIYEPKINSETLNYILAKNTYSTLAFYMTDPTDDTQIPSTVDMDSIAFCYPVSVGSGIHWNFYQLTRKGERFYKLFKSLGYDLASYEYLPQNSGESVTDWLARIRATATYYHTAMPFLAYIKVWQDMFLNSQFYNQFIGVAFMRAIHDNESYSYNGTQFYNANNGLLESDGIEFLFNDLHLPHEKNLYLDSWNTPNSPTGQPSDTQVTKGDELMSPILPTPGVVANNYGSTDSASVDTDATFINSKLLGTGSPSSSPNLNSITQYGLNFLNSLYKFVKRNNLFGSKSVERVFARFGIKSDDFSSHFVHKLFEASDKIPFGAVMSNSDTTISGTQDGKPLGSYAGAGGSDNVLSYDFNYKCSDYGYIVCLAWLQIVPITMHGSDPQTLRVLPFDFFTPEFDGKALRAIPKCEVSINKRANNAAGEANGDKSILGFCGLYDDYREMRDSVFGAFLIGKTKNFMFARDISKLRESKRIFQSQSTVMQYYGNDGNNPDLTDPFQYLSTMGDRFYFQIDWTIDASTPVLSKSDSLDLNGSGDVELKINGQMMQ